MQFKLSLIAVALFVAVAASRQDNYGWQQGKEYVYKVKSRLMSGQPELKQQYAGFEIKHKLVIQVQNQDALLIKVTDSNIGELNEVILGDWWTTKIPVESGSLSSETKRMLETPFIIKMKDGQVDHIKVDENEVHFIRNFKKALASTLQLDNRAINPASLARVDNKIVKTMEETILGECEFVYEKHLMPEHLVEVQQEERVPILDACRNSPVWEVTKTANFTNCRTMPVYNTVTPKGLWNCLPGDNACKHFWQRTYQARYVLCGGLERGLIQSIDAEEEFLVNPFGYKTEKLMGGTVTNMTLYDIRPIQTRLHLPRQLMTIQNLEMKQPVFKHQQKTHSGEFWTRSQDDFEYGRQSRQFGKYNDEAEQEEDEERQGETRFGQRYPSIYDSSNDYSRMLDDESRRFRRSIDDESDDESIYEPSLFGKSHKGSYWNRVFNPRKYNREFDTTSTYGSEYESRAYSGHYNPRRIEREDKLVKSGNYPYPSLTKPLLFVHPKRVNFDEIVSNVPELVFEIARNLEHPSQLAQKNILDKIVSVAAKLEVLSLEQLHKVYEKCMIAARYETTIKHESETSRRYQTAERTTQKTVKNVFFDALAMSGTNPAIVLIKQLIKKNEIRGEQAAQLIMTFPKYSKTPTKELIDEIFDLATTYNGEHSEQIRTTALLAFSQLVHQSCVSPRTQYTRYPVEIFGKFCTKDSGIINKYISYLANKLHSTQSEYKKAVYIQCLGNIGHKNIIPALKPIISNDIKSTADVRTKAVQALKKLVQPQSYYRKHNFNLVKHVSQYLVSVILDPTIHYQVRMAAFEVFTATDAPLVYWQKIAMRTWFEPSNQVCAYIRSTLKSLAKLETKIPHFLNLEKKAKQVLPLTKPIKEGMQYSYNHIVSHFTEEMELGYIQQIATFGAKDSIIPESIKFDSIHQLGGFNFRPFKFDLKTKNIREVIEKLLHQYVFAPLSPREGGYNAQLDKIKEILNVVPRHAKGPMQGSLYVKLAEEIQRMFPVNHESINHLIRKFVEEYPRLESGIPINYQKALNLADMTIVLPTQMGVPYILKIRVPALISLKGHIKIQTQQPEGRSHIGVPEKVKIVLDLSPVYTWKVIATAGFTTYSNLKTYATGVEKKFTFHLPGAIVIRADLKQKQLAISHVLPETHQFQNPQDVEIITYKVKPFTTIYNLKKMAAITHTDKLKTIKITEEPKKVNKHIGLKYFGLAAKLEQTTDGELEDVHDLLKKLYKHSPLGLIKFWHASKSNKQRKYRLTLDLQQSQTKETTILFDYDKIVKSVSSLEASEIASGRHFAIGNTKYDNTKYGIDSEEEELESIRRRSHSGKPFFPRTSSAYGSEEEQTRFHGLKNEYTANEEDSEYLRSGRRQQIADERIITRFEGRHTTEMERIVMEKVLSEITSGYVYKVKVALILRGAEKRDYTANLIVAVNPSNTIKKTQLIFERSPLSHYERNSFKVLFDAESKFPQVPISDLTTAEGMDMTSFFKAKIFAGHNIERESQIRIEGVMKRTEEVKKHLQSLKKVAECEKHQQHGFRLHPTCVNATTVAATLNEYRFNIEYRNVPSELRNLTWHVQEMLTAVWYPYLTTNHAEVQNQHNLIQVVAKVHPIQKNFDLKIKKPTATILFEKVPLDTQKATVFPINAKKSIVARTFNKILGGNYNTKCLMGKNKIATFDKVVYDAKLEREAFHLLTKDCSGLYKFAVLVKQHENKRVVRVIAKNTVVQTMSSATGHAFATAGLRVIVNGREQVLPVDKIVEITEQGKTVIRLIAKPNGVIEIRAPKHGFVVLTNGEQVIVKASNFLRNSLCGLCGDFNGEKTADLKTPEKCVESPREPRDFVRSYAIESSSNINERRSIGDERRSIGDERRSSSFYKYLNTPVSYLSNYFGGRNIADDNEEEQSRRHELIGGEDEIVFGRRSQYTRTQCVRELDDSTRDGKQWRKENSLVGSGRQIGGGSHDYLRTWEQQSPKYDTEFETTDDDEDITTADRFENILKDRSQRRRYQDEEDYQTEEEFFKNYDSSVFNKDALFADEFAGRQFGEGYDTEEEYDSQDAWNKEWNVEGRYPSYNKEHNVEGRYPSYNRERNVEGRYPSYNREWSNARHNPNIVRDIQNVDSVEEELINRPENINRRQFNIDSDEEISERRNIFNKAFDSDYERENKFANIESNEDEEYNRNYYNSHNKKRFNKLNKGLDSQETNEDFEDINELEHSRQNPFVSRVGSDRCTVLKHKIIERNGKKCFSVRPKVQCSKQIEQCKPIARNNQQVRFYCAQTPLEARHLEQQVRQQSEVRQLIEKPTHFTEEIDLPTECALDTRAY